MPIEFRCTNCQKLLRTPDETAGKQAKCPSCGRMVPIPDASEAAAVGEAAPGTSGPTGQGGNPFRMAPPPGGGGTGTASDSGNPYQAPSGRGGATVEVAHQPSDADFGRSQINSIEVLRRAWAIYTNNLAACIGAALLCLIVVLATGSIFFLVFILLGSSIFGGANDVLGILAAVSGVLAMYVIITWIVLGLVSYYIAVARGESPRIGKLFSAGWYVLPTVVAYILLYIGSNILGMGLIMVMALLAVAAQAVAGEAGMLLLLLSGYAAAFLVQMVVWLYFSQFAFLIVDREIGPIASLIESFHVMRGNQLAYLLVLIIGTIINLFGVLLIGIGAIFTTPFFIMLMVVAYLSITGQLATPAPAAVQYDA